MYANGPNAFPSLGQTKRTARAFRLLLLLVVLRPIGNVLLAWGMKHSSSVFSATPLTYLRTITNPFVIGGVLFLVLALLIRMAMLSIADLSLVVPLTASGYIVTTFLGRFVLNEHVSNEQWVGSFLIFLGASLVTSEMRPVIV